MSIQNSLNVPLPLTAETATMQAALVEKIKAHNDECDSIAEAEAELKDTPDSDWTLSHSKAVAKIQDRKLESLHVELSLRKETGDFLTRAITVDHPKAATAARIAVEEAKKKAIAYLVAGGWVETKTEIGNGIELLPIDYSVLMRNREMCQATLAANSLTESPLIEARRLNAEAMEKTKERFAAVKSKAMALQV